MNPKDDGYTLLTEEAVKMMVNAQKMVFMKIIDDDDSSAIDFMAHTAMGLLAKVVLSLSACSNPKTCTNPHLSPVEIFDDMVKTMRRAYISAEHRASMHRTESH